MLPCPTGSAGGKELLVSGTSDSSTISAQSKLVPGGGFTGGTEHPNMASSDSCRCHGCSFSIYLFHEVPSDKCTINETDPIRLVSSSHTQVPLPEL